MFGYVCMCFKGKTSRISNEYSKWQQKCKAAKFS